ncbi:cytochrome P450 [Xylaria arbuscula]|nr:cytochrome P450 [Xylaria arbuscula]
MMESSSEIFSWLFVTFVSVALIPLTVVIYRLTLHPLSRFPGPKVAAATRYFEGYYDAIQNGKYTHKIAKMHGEYGTPIIRISPHELHISDAGYFDALYNREGRWNKYDWAYNAHGTPLSTLSAIDHNVHKRRRAAMNPFFSKASVASRQQVVQELTTQLCHRLDNLISREVKLAAALGAFTRDVATEFLLGKSFDNLGAEDFSAGVGNTLQESGAIWRITKHFRWYGPLIQSVPTWVVKKIGDPGIVECLGFVEDMANTTKAIHAAWTNRNTVQDATTIVDTILDSDLPPTEKTPDRLKDEIITVAGAAFETTAYSLCKILYHVYADPEVLRRLRAELVAAGVAGTDASLAKLEKLPYLTAVLTEGLRLSPAIATRMARVAPDRDLTYVKWKIPSGTPVGMTLMLMHTDPDLYADPLHFEPDRWLGQGSKAHKAYAPFGQGTRMCIGMQ